MHEYPAAGPLYKSGYAVDDADHMVNSWWKNGENGSNEGEFIVESIVYRFVRSVVGEAMFKWSHNSTLYCTLSH